MPSTSQNSAVGSVTSNSSTTDGGTTIPTTSTGTRGLKREAKGETIPPSLPVESITTVVKRPKLILSHDDDNDGSSTLVPCFDTVHVLETQQCAASASAAAVSSPLVSARVPDYHERSHPVTPQTETKAQPATTISSLLAVGVGSWTAEQHRDFACAVFLAGMRTSSPAVILDSLQKGSTEINHYANLSILSPATITSANVKSHLQKYRKNKERNLKDFLEGYDSWMQTVKTLTSNLNVPRDKDCTVNTWRALNANTVFQLRELMNPDTLGPGEMAAFLSFRAMMHQKKRIKASAARETAAITGPQAVKSCHGNYVNKSGDENGLEKHLAYESVGYPKLTEAEKCSPIGMGLEFTKMLLSTIHAQVERQRRSQFGLPPTLGDDAAALNDDEQGNDGRLRSLSFASQTHHEFHRLPAPWGSPMSHPAYSLLPNTDSCSDLSLSPQAIRGLYIPPSHQENGFVGASHHNYCHQDPSRKRFREEPPHFRLEDDDLSLSTTLTGEDARDHTLLTDLHHHSHGRNHNRSISISGHFVDSYFGVDARLAYDHAIYPDLQRNDAGWTLPPS